MIKSEIVSARRALLAAEITKQGLSTLAKNTSKPASQIKDMAAGRKTFGDRIAIELGPLIRPDLPRDWLVYPADTIYALNKVDASLSVDQTIEHWPASQSTNVAEIPEEVLTLARRILKIPPDLYPVIEGALLGAEMMAEQRRPAANDD